MFHKIVNQANYVVTKASFEENIGDSKTVQGESHTITDLLTKHAAGMLPNVERNTYFEDTEDYDAIDLGKLAQLDLTEQDEIVEDNKYKIALLKTKGEQLQKIQRESLEKQTKLDSEKSTEKAIESETKEQLKSEKKKE